MPKSGSDQDELYEEEFEFYERQYASRQRVRRGRRPEIKHIAKRPEEEVIVDLGELVGLEAGFKPTYEPGRHEEGWLLDSLRHFYEESLIVDVLSQIKGGKEASVYLCAAHASTGADLLAAKVYRPRRFRNLRNDKQYRQGRDVLTDDGRPAKTTDHRIMRAIGKKTAFGVQVMHTSWLMHEYKALELLYAAGGAVPRPYAAGENAILMSYCGDAQTAAPALSDVHLAAGEAQPIWEETVRNVNLMLERGLIHGDLSPYNVLYWQGQMTIIDLPQAVDAYRNPDAYAILARDLTRMAEYLVRHGAVCEADALLEELWSRHALPLPGELEMLESAPTPGV